MESQKEIKTKWLLFTQDSGGQILGCSLVAMTQQLDQT
jgi:hypothetical protein